MGWFVNSSYKIEFVFLITTSHQVLVFPEMISGHYSNFSYAYVFHEYRWLTWTRVVDERENLKNELELVMNLMQKMLELVSSHNETKS